jgi:hypothetical protein
MLFRDCAGTEIRFSQRFALGYLRLKIGEIDWILCRINSVQGFPERWKRVLSIVDLSVCHILYAQRHCSRERVFARRVQQFVGHRRGSAGFALAFIASYPDRDRDVLARWEA